MPYHRLFNRRQPSHAAVEATRARGTAGALRSGIVSKGAALLLLLCTGAHVVHVTRWTHRSAPQHLARSQEVLSFRSAVADSGSYDGAHQGGRANYGVASVDTELHVAPHAHRKPQWLTGAWPSEIEPAHLDAMLRLPSADAASRRASPLQPLPLRRVRLLPGSAEAEAQERNRRYLLDILDADRLLHSFRVTAGLAPRAQAYCAPGSGTSWEELGGACWEAPDCELRGHFTGHYLSALAMLHVSTGDDIARQRAEYVVAEMAAAQAAHGTSGYLSAFPEATLSRLSKLKGVWAPVYTLHKVGAGLLDAHVLLGSTQALSVLRGLADYLLMWSEDIVAAHGDDYWFRKLMEYNVTAFGAESGGMNELAFNLYALTADARYLSLASKFEHPEWQNAMLNEWDVLGQRHANFHIPLAVGTARRAELFAEPPSCAMPRRFFAMLVSSGRLYATGGTSTGERWPRAHNGMYGLGTETQETCTSYNLLKLARHLYGWTGGVELADYLERNQLNAVLGTQRGPGEFLYTLPLGRGVSKAASGHGWGHPQAAFWCCYGSAVESFARLGEDVFFVGAVSTEAGSCPTATAPLSHTRPTLYINRLVSAHADWSDAGVEVIVTAALLPDTAAAAAAVSVVSVQVMWADTPVATAVGIRLRVPGWARGGASHPTLHVDGVLTACVAPEHMPHYCEVLCVRAAGATTLRLTLPFAVRAERLDDASAGVPASFALLAGPLVLAGLGESAFVARLSHAAAATAIPAAIFAEGTPLVSLRLIAPVFRHRYLVTTAAFAHDSTTLLGYAVEPRRPDVQPQARPAGGTGFHYSPPPSGECADAPDADAGACTHLFLDATAATFRAVPAEEGGGGGGGWGGDALLELRRGVPWLLEPFSAPGMRLGRAAEAAVQGLVAARAAGPAALRLRLVPPPLQLRAAASPGQGETVYTWPEGVWMEGSMVMEDAGAAGWLLTVWDPAAETRERLCADVQRGGGCSKNAVWGMCRAGAQGTAGVLGQCARTCGRCEAERMPLRVVDVRTLPADCAAGTTTAGRRALASAEAVVRHCVFRRDVAQRFALRSALELTPGLVAAYPRGAFVVEAGSDQAVTHALMAPLNALADEWYTVHYPLDPP